MKYEKRKKEEKVLDSNQRSHTLVMRIVVDNIPRATFVHVIKKKIINQAVLLFIRNACAILSRRRRHSPCYP